VNCVVWIQRERLYDSLRNTSIVHCSLHLVDLQHLGSDAMKLPDINKRFLCWARNSEYRKPLRWQLAAQLRIIRRQEGNKKAIVYREYLVWLATYPWNKAMR